MGPIDITVFIFAFFVFVLLCGMIWLYSRLKRPKKSAEDAVSEKEKRLYKLYQNLEDMMNGIEEYVEEARTGIAKDKEEIAAIHAKIENMHTIYKNDIQARVEEEARPKEKEAEKPAVAEAPAKKEIKIPRNMSKSEVVRYLKDEGMEEDKIAKELGISKGEVLLILGLKKS
jgi:biopolymer transport protein ExbB/TolQ